MVRKNNNKGYVLTEVLVVTVVVMAAFLAIYVNYYPMLGEYERRVAYTNLEPKYSLFYMKKLYLTSYSNENILSEFRSNNNLKYLNLLKTEGNKLVCKDNYVDDLVSCNSLIEYHGIKQLIVSEYNVDDLKSISIEKNLDKYIDYLPSYKYVNDKKLFRLTIETDAGYATTEFDLLRTRKSLYAVLEDAAYDGTYAKKYTGSHQDSMDASLSNKDIYYWYGSSAANGTAIKDKNNVIFANHCWQMIRTTDTGGVRMIYNGEEEDGKCLNTRGTHIGYAPRTSQSLNGTYWYGTDYESYDDGTFSIWGTKSSVEVTSSNGSTVIPTLVGKYTCKSTSQNGRCSTLYLIESYYSGYNAYAIPLNFNSNYSQFGTLQFNANSNSPADVGYMYNTVYSGTFKNYSYENVLTTGLALSTTYYYADSYDYNETNANKYTLTNPYKVNSTSDYSSLVGKYTFRNTSATYSNTQIYYIVGINSTSAYCINITNGNDLSYYINDKYTYGDSYTDNGNGTYTINNPTTINRIDYYTNYTNVKNKYVCKNATNNTCSDVWHANSGLNQTYIYHYKSSSLYKYAKGFTYNSSTEEYTLNSDSVTFWDTLDSGITTSLNTHHYTCFDTTGVCSTLSYVYYNSAGNLYYINLTGGKDIDDVLEEMLTANNVNTKNSIMKLGIDAWYKKYLLPYDSYIDDTIYCNDRSIRSLGGWNATNGSVTSYLQFKEYTATSDLSCTNITDRFSVTNNNARLIYKVGLISSPEIKLLNNSNALKTGQTYWLVSPDYFGISSASGCYVHSSGGSGSGSVNGTQGVRPAVSLIPGMRYSSGDGSMANPYVVITDEPSV